MRPWVVSQPVNNAKIRTMFQLAGGLGLVACIDRSYAHWGYGDGRNRCRVYALPQQKATSEDTKAQVAQLLNQREREEEKVLVQRPLPALISLGIENELLDGEETIESDFTENLRISTV